MKKLLLSLATIALYIAYSVHQHLDAAPLANNAPIVFPSPTTTHSSGFKDGQYTGDTVDAYYGNIQVQATVQSGRLADVQFLQYPNDRRTSIEVNSQAMPILKQEAITAQSAAVDIVSGATDSSQAFIQSLTSALNHAK